MKNQILYSEITKAVEDLAQALRKFSDAPMYASASVATRDTSKRHGGDWYTITVHDIKDTAEEDEATDPIIGEAGVIIRDSDGMIAKVERLGGST